MAKKKNRGRPQKPGERYPGGKLKPTKAYDVEPIAPALWQRIKSDGAKLGLDPRLATEIGRLAMHGELTSAQVAAGFRVAEIYGRFERYHGRRRSACSPSYQSGMRGESAVAEEFLGEQELDALKERQRNAEAALTALQGEIPRAWRWAIEQLCVEDRAVDWGELWYIRTILDDLGSYFGISASRKKSKTGKPKRPAEQADAARRLAPSVDKIYWMEVVRRLRPDLDDASLGRAYDIQRALIVRADLRRQKRGETLVGVNEFRKSARRSGSRAPARQSAPRRNPTTMGTGTGG